MEKEILNEKLMSGIKFSQSDLSFNQQGMLTPSQIQSLKESVYFSKSTNNKLWLGIMGGGALIYLTRQDFDSFSWISLAWIGGFMAFYYLIFKFFNGSKLKKLEEGKIPVEKIQGKIHAFQDAEAASGASLGQYGGIVKSATSFAGMNFADYSHVVQVGEKKFYTTKNIQEAFQEGQNYDVYFIRTAKVEYQNILHGVIVSAEVI